jgi:hypothetical protein
VKCNCCNKKSQLFPSGQEVAEKDLVWLNESEDSGYEKEFFGEEKTTDEEWLNEMN